jgi:serine/threonine protein kinase
MKVNRSYSSASTASSSEASEAQKLPTTNKGGFSRAKTEELKTKPSDLKSLRVKGVINKSKFTVYLVEAPKLGKQFAMKVFPHAKDGKPHVCFEKESRFANLKHENIISIVDSVAERPSSSHGQSFNVSYILMELAPYGDLADLIMSNYYPHDNEKLVRTLFHQIVEGVEYLHARDIAHMDLKPENILLGEDGLLKVTDFDSSVFVDKERVISKVGTRNYRAPECISCNAKDLFAADIFSLGVILFILKVGIFPYAEDMEI